MRVDFIPLSANDYGTKADDTPFFMICGRGGIPDPVRLLGSVSALLDAFRVQTKMHVDIYRMKPS